MSKKQSMLNPSKTTTKKAQGMLITSIGFYLSRSWLLEMFLRHTTLHICMVIHKYMYI